MIDTYFIFFYLIIDDVSDDELDFRKNIWDYHGEKKRLEFLVRINPEHELIKGMSNELNVKKNSISSNNLFNLLDKTKKRNILKGKIAFYHTNSELSEKAGINQQYYKSAYDYLSGYIHSFPHAMSQLALFRAVGEDETNLFNTVIQFAVNYLSISIDNYISFFPDQKKIISGEVSDIIEESKLLLKNVMRMSD